jgi:hypothetical protein
MLRIERIFEAGAIAEELATYNPLIPDGTNLKATMLIEYADEAQRRIELAQLRGIEHDIALQVGDLAQVKAIADEDMERSNEEKTSAVHFLRFELTTAMIAALRAGAALRLVIDHGHYRAQAEASAETRAALLADFD